ncbi:tripartite tricarboxylate transporter TctB family protein [Yoonia sp.]|uniref:tripartite tricarboxylate transporter TctB family protein n=1 Tax=Yoonia sp. TaxID=2212373 RepID=UPI00391C69F4
MSGDQQNKAAEEELRLPFDDDAGAGTGKRDAAGLAIAVGLFVLAAVIVNDASGYAIRRSYARFGPEIVPYVVASGIAVLAVITVFMAWRGQFEARDRMNWGGFTWLTGGIVVEIAMLYGGTGFIAGSTVLFAFAARAFGQATWLVNIAIGVVLSTALFLLFRYGLGLSLPNGPVERAIDLLLR